jgi:1-acyl-sn-glycerol-3-phosphate acyltransferase
MLEFKPPKPNQIVITLFRLAFPLELMRAQIEVEPMGDTMQRLRQLHGKHAVLVCNHSNQYDPEVIFALSLMLSEDFRYIVAREVFDWVFGSVGWLFQSLGNYSVSRGHADVESFETTRRIIAAGKNKLVMFPEGEVTRRPDFLLPLRHGTARLLLEGQKRLLSEKPDEPVLVQPLGIRWRYKHNITRWLSWITSRIEQRLGLNSSGAGLAQRVHAAAAAMLAVLEEEYGCPSRADLPFEERVFQLREQILQQLSAIVQVQKPESGSHVRWLRRALNAIADFANADTASMSRFQRRVHQRQAAKSLRFIADCRRVQHLIGVVPPAERRPLTQERLAAMISFIERQVFGFVLPKGPRVAMVSAGEAFSLLNFHNQYLHDQQQAIEAVTEKMADEMQALIDLLDRSIGNFSSQETLV